MSTPNKVSRRGFLGIFRKEPDQRSAPEAAAAAEAPSPKPKPEAEGFSLEAFYAARVPATELYVTLAPGLPQVATTAVGVPDLVRSDCPAAPDCPDEATVAEARVANTNPIRRGRLS